jgi:hypothetical protein
MKLTPEQRSERARDRLLESAKQFQLGTYSNRYVAPLFQQMIRAEAGAMPTGFYPVIFGGELAQANKERGQCVCVTCGKAYAWDSGIKGMHTGHFLASRRMSILFEEDNCAPQCSACNFYGSGQQQLFRKWMLEVRGIEVVERLEMLKNQVRTFSREELVDMRIAFAARLKAAELRMKGF